MNAFDGATLTQVLQRGDQWLRPLQTREQTDATVKLTQSLNELFVFNQGLQKRPRYGYSVVWQHFNAARAQSAAAATSQVVQQPSRPLPGALVDSSLVTSIKAPSTFVSSDPALSLDQQPLYLERGSNMPICSSVPHFSFAQSSFHAQMPAPGAIKVSAAASSIPAIIAPAVALTFGNVFGATAATYIHAPASTNVPPPLPIQACFRRLYAPELRATSTSRDAHLPRLNRTFSR